MTDSNSFFTLNSSNNFWSLNSVTRHCADSVKLPNPARLVTVSEWRAPASQCRAAVSGETHPDTGDRPTAVSGYRRSVLQPTANCQASKARAWHTEGRWPRATPRRRVPSTSSAPLTLMEIRFWKVGQWGRRIAVGNICAQVSLEKYKGHVCIIVNVASKWGKTDVNYKWVWLIWWEICFRNSSSADELLVCTQLGC